jgi:hypothetical protein
VVIAGNVMVALFLIQLARHFRRPALTWTLFAFVVAAFILQVVNLVVVATKLEFIDDGPTRLGRVVMGLAPVWVYVLGLLFVLWFAFEVFWARAVLARR